MSANVKAIIYDGNPVNQAFCKMYTFVPGKPWLTVDGKYLLYDFVHLIKSIRNLWLTEKFDDNRVTRIAKWTHLKQLYNTESRSFLKLSDLNEISISPKPVERQCVLTVLRVFSE